MGVSGSGCGALPSAGASVLTFAELPSPFEARARTRATGAIAAAWPPKVATWEASGQACCECLKAECA
eukprot:8283122-Alexandrium_andersonii.AAC.1